MTETKIKTSIPRIVNVRLTERGSQDAELKAFLYRRLGPDRNDWIRQRFEVVQ